MNEHICIICFEAIDLFKKNKLSCKCNSFFHDICIQKWFLHHTHDNKCPSCRREVVINRPFESVEKLLKNINYFTFLIFLFVFSFDLNVRIILTFFHLFVKNDHMLITIFAFIRILSLFLLYTENKEKFCILGFFNVLFCFVSFLFGSNVSLIILEKYCLNFIFWLFTIFRVFLIFINFYKKQIECIKIFMYK